MVVIPFSYVGGLAQGGRVLTIPPGIAGTLSRGSIMSEPIGKVPKGYSALPTAVNIQRLGPKSKRNDFVCREEGCNWKERCALSTAKAHGRRHSKTKKCHIFEAVDRNTLLTQVSEKNKAKCKRYRAKLKVSGRQTT